MRRLIIVLVLAGLMVVGFRVKVASHRRGWRWLPRPKEVDS